MSSHSTNVSGSPKAASSNEPAHVAAVQIQHAGNSLVTEPAKDTIKGRPVLVIWPAAVQMDGGEEHPRQTILREIGGETSTTVVEPLAAFRAQGGERLYADAVHATATGYLVAAKEIAAALETLR